MFLIYNVNLEGPLRSLEYFLLTEHDTKAALRRLSSNLFLLSLYTCLCLHLLSLWFL